MKTQYRTIDLFKFICAILIIILHTAPFSSYSKVLSFATRTILTTVAVPFFFISSGFITREKSNYQTAYIKRYAKRIFMMYVIWSVVYFPFVVLKWQFDEAFIDGIIPIVLEYIKDFVFEGSYSTIWFLPTLLTSTLLVWILHKKFSYLQIFLISLPVYIFTLAGSSYYGLSQKIPFLEAVFDAYYGFFDTIKNGVCFGLIFVSLGALISEKKDEIILGNKKNLLAIVIFWGLLAVEQLCLAFLNWNSKGVDTTVMILPLSFFLFVFILNLQLEDNGIYARMRKYSLLLFLCQRIPITIAEMWLKDTIITANSVVYLLVYLFAQC